ncbi:MAG: hypothetical protein IJ317_02840 [Clostridia bacterium]|nr:hypothetical protein [Clostridia bacterium]
MRKNKFLALCLSVMMLSSTAAALAACAEDETTTDDGSTSTESTESTSTPKDTGIIKNMGFELDETDAEKPIITSVTGWTRAVNSATSGSALSSKAASGVIDTANWDDLTTSNLGDLTIDGLVADEEKAAANWDKLTTKDKLEYYEAWEEANKDDDEKDIEDLEFYQSFNIDAEDLPAATVANPGTHDAENTDDTSVLMIHNEYSNSTYDSFGTAQKFTSSSTVTVTAGTRAEFSVWVKTSDLTSTNSYGDEQPAVNKGAYISVTNTVGGKTMDPVEIVNIQADEWTKYTFTLQSASFADSTFTIVLGLGKGGGTDRSEYVNGYAFFDDITCKTDVASEITDATIDFASDKDDRTLDATNKNVVIDYSDSETASEIDLNGFDIASALTKEKIGSKEYTAEEWLGVTWDKSKDIGGALKTGAEIKALTDNAYAQTVYNNYLGESEDNTEMFVFLSASGAAYTTEVKSKGNDYLVTLPAETYTAISFFVKTSNLNGFTGANVTVVDGDNKTSISSIDTSKIEGVDLIGADGKTTKEDVYNGWQQCFIFLSNDTEDDQSFYLEFTFGPTAVQDTAESAYYPGFAAFKDFQVYENLSKEAYECATSGTYTSVVTLTEESDEAAGDSGFDSPMGVPSDAIENGYAFPQNYRGVYSDDGLVSGVGSSSVNTPADGLTTGLLNKEHADNYTEILQTLGGDNATWASVFGDDVTQPLVIYNGAAQTKAYGYIGATTSLSASAYTTISMRVKTSAGAKASIYLIDTDDKTRASTLTIGAKTTYWYDDDGNICVSDPTKSAFNEKKDIAFKLQSNGLYKVNEKWSGAANVDKNAYYANLAAYTEKDEAGNLLVAENGVSYDYTDKWKNDGNDGIAYYYKEGKYYADSAYTTVVNNLADVTELPVRTEAQAAKALQYTEIDTNGEWAIVTFYIHTGDVAKNYRLEVWSGTRDGSAVNGAYSYVMFDAYKPADVDATSFANLIKERQDLGAEYFESVYSFYDTDKFLRYDETADKNEVGNSYESYLSSAYAKSVAYLTYQADGVYETYADYALSEIEVAADAEETDDDTTDEADETSGETTNVWLLASSIAIAGVLLLAVASLIIRKAMKNRRKHSATVAPKSKKSKKN